MVVVAVCGLGNFGYAVLKHLDNKYFKVDEVTLRGYDYDKSVIDSLMSTHKHPFLFPNVSLSNKVTFVDSYEELAKDADVLVLAVSSQATRPAISGLKKHFKKGVIIVNTAKALDYQTGDRLSKIIAKELQDVDYSYAAFAGGTIAKDLFKHEPLGVTISSLQSEQLPKLKKLFEAGNLFVETTNDLTGVELAGAFKNVISVLAGCVKGMGFSYGSETRIISSTAGAIAEICCEKFGAKPETFSMSSQCWGNDMWMSTTGKTRNREFGEILGSTQDVNMANKHMKEQKKTVEAISTLEAFESFQELRNIPMLSLLHDIVISKTKSVEDLKKALLSGAA